MKSMEIVNRTENKLLNRVEIDFSWQHIGLATPSRKEVMDLVRTLEPKSNPDCIVVKNCNTRFGQPLTTGTAFVYGEVAAMNVEPSYIHKRHEQFWTPKAPEAEESSKGGDE
tara:strand:+ start:265 stop:600 length:336 start_codon:yes stop_codon:yes gene_type:complete